MNEYEQFEQLRLTEAEAIQKPKRRRRRKTPKISAAVLAICVAASSLFGFIGGTAAGLLQSHNNYDLYQDVGMAEEEKSHEIINLTAAAGNSTATIASTASVVRQSVVEISTETVSTNYWMRQLITEGAGSGVIITADGYIVTNHHVVANARSITVGLTNGKKYPAVLIGSDSRTDLAVLKIGETNLTPAVLGDSSKLVVGELAIAVGNPLGELGGTVTSGIISALGREITIDGETMSLLQTDAAINPGNSGGGLFSINGQLVGIVNAKSSGSNIEGIGFAIPLNSAMPVIKDIIEYGYVRGRIETGLTLVDIPNVQIAMWYRVSHLGLYILKSENPELQNGDRITAVDGKNITNIASFEPFPVKGFFCRLFVFIVTEHNNITFNAYFAVTVFVRL